MNVQILPTTTRRVVGGVLLVVVVPGKSSTRVAIHASLPVCLFHEGGYDLYVPVRLFATPSVRVGSVLLLPVVRLTATRSIIRVGSVLLLLLVRLTATRSITLFSVADLREPEQLFSVFL